MQIWFFFLTKCTETISVSKYLVKQDQLVTTSEWAVKEIWNIEAICSSVKVHLFVHFIPFSSMC